MTIPFVDEWRPRVEAELASLVPSAEVWPGRLHEAMRYSLLAGGKRLRPILALAAARACGGELPAILPAACGLEMIHTYSLIHDDLPALDNDDLRRGVPTCHRKFDEPTAILAGDALLTHGLGLFAVHPAGKRYEPARLAALSTVVDAIGTLGMIGGQMEDLEAERREPTRREDEAARLDRIHRHKTGALIRAALVVGGILSLADEASVNRLGRYGELLGLAFQIKDDLLDVESSREALGKEAGKDAGRRKLTFPIIHGVEESHRILDRTVEEAGAVAREVEKIEGPLAALAQFVSDRKS